MAKKEGDWAFPVEMRPRPEEWRFNLEHALDSVVGLRAEIPDDAFTAQILGTLRAGSGVVIRDDGLVLTIGYLVTEASTIWLTTNKGNVVGGFPLAYDQTTGFGLVHPLGKLGGPNRPPRPWLGLYATEAGPRLVVAGLAPGGPAEKAGVKVGDAVLEVAGAKPSSLADLFRRIWACGSAGARVPLKLLRETSTREAVLTSVDRNDFLKKPHLH